MTGQTDDKASPKPQRVFLIDGTALAYRSYFAFARRPLITSKGVNTSAVFGFTSSLFKLLDAEHPELLAMVFDSPGPTFRHEAFAEYKATREKMPDEMGEQLPLIDKIVEAFRIPRLSVPGFEADDVIGTLAKAAEREGLECFIYTADKDFMQLVTERVKVYNAFRKGEEVEVLDPAGVAAKFGAPPEKVVDVLALMGDSSDNVPGVPGIGEKGAVALIAEYGSVEAALDNADKVKGKRAREGLLSGRESAMLSKALVTIDTSVPLDLSIADLHMQEPDADALLELFKELEFGSLLERLRGAGARAGAEEGRSYTLVEDDKTLKHLLRLLKSADSFVFDLETTSLNPLDAEIVGISFAVREREAFYVPAAFSAARSGAGGLFPTAQPQASEMLKKFKPLLEDESKKKGGQNVKYDMLVLRQYGVNVRGIAFDTMVASYLVDPSLRQHGLDALSLRYLDYKKIPTTDLIGKGKDQISMADVEVATVCEYACEDADMTLRLKAVFDPRIDALGLRSLYEDVEAPLISVLADMEEAGIRLDPGVLAEMSKQMGGKLAELETKIHGLAGTDFNINSPKQLGEIMFGKMQLHNELGIGRVKKTKTGYSTDVSVMEQMAGHPFVDAVLAYRSLSKLKGTYVDTLPALVSPRTGRLHTSFNQTVTATGRLSSSDPNLQNIPVRSDWGRRIRSAFVPSDQDHLLLSADYSQIELRVLAHLSKDQNLLDTFQRGEDVHRRTAALVFGVEPDDVQPDMRDRAKAINFGVIYGMGSRRLARGTGISLDDAKRFIDAYFDKYPGIKEFTAASVSQARTEGYVKTILGRRRNLPEIHSRNRGQEVAAERMAVNTPIQGSAADIIKVAMVSLARRLSHEDADAKMLLQVHDELLFEVRRDDADRVADTVREEMEQAVRLSVPVKVDVALGENWMEAH